MTLRINMMTVILTPKIGPTEFTLTVRIRCKNLFLIPNIGPYLAHSLLLFSPIIWWFTVYFFNNRSEKSNPEDKQCVIPEGWSTPYDLDPAIQVKNFKTLAKGKRFFLHIQSVEFLYILTYRNITNRKQYTVKAKSSIA